MKKRLILLALAVLTMMVMLVVLTWENPAVSAQDGATPTPTVDVTIRQGGDYLGRVFSRSTLRGYLLHVPESYDPNTPTPLILSYHGFTGDPVEHAQNTGWSLKSDEEGFLVVYPAGQREPLGWYTQPGAEEAGWYDDVQFTRDLLSHLYERLNIDPARIYLTGFSNGGGMVHRLACDLSDTIAAFAPVAGPHFVGDPCDITRPIAVFATHGKLDNNAKFDGYYDLLMPMPDWIQAWADRNGCDPEPEETTPEEGVIVQVWNNCEDDATVLFRIYELGRHEWFEGTEDRIWDFFVEHPMPEQYLTETEE